MANTKPRYYFDLYGYNIHIKEQYWIGYGWSYDEGNCQVVMKGHKTGPWQFASLEQVLKLNEVKTFQWR